jgi:DNA polymerase-1
VKIIGLDCETTEIPDNGYDLPDVLHCIVTSEYGVDPAVGTARWTCLDNFNGFLEYVSDVDKFVMHNGVAFDARVLNRLLGTKIKVSQIIDTLILSQLDNPIIKGGHSLAAWGERFKYPKDTFSDYTQYSPELLNRCEVDVEITMKLFRYLSTRKINPKAYQLEAKVRSLVSQQEVNGFTLDIQKVIALQNKLTTLSNTLEELITESFGPLPKHVRDYTLRHNSDGSISKVGLNHLKDTDVAVVVAGDHSVIDWPAFNLNSRQQIAKHLVNRGWNPTKFTEKTEEPIISETTLKGVDIPEATLLAENLMVVSRIADTRNWIKAYQEDGKVHGTVYTIGAVTNRMAHVEPNVAQVPASYSPYGPEMRECFTASEGLVLVGADASGLELRCLAHYMNDANYIKEILEGDIHTVNMHAAGLTNRDTAKTFFYAWLYGAGPAKIGQIVGGTSKDGKALIDKFLESLPPLKALKERVQDLVPKGGRQGLQAAGRLEAIDGRMLVVKSEHAALNVLLQGAGAVICKQWLVDIDTLNYKRGTGAKLVASIHDEYQHDCLPDKAEEFGQLTKDAIKITERKLGLNCPLDSEYKVGVNWRLTH